MNRLTAFAAGFFLSLAGAASAQVTHYDCQVKSSSSGGFIAERLVIGVDSESGRARVIDGVVNFVYEAPVDAKLTQRTRGNIGVQWEVIGFQARNGKVNLNYSAIIFAKSNRVSVTGLVRGFDNDVRADGRCQVAEGINLF